MRSFLLACALVLAACGGSDTKAPTCNGTSCQCPAMTSCDLGNSGCSGDSCTLDCTNNATCTGSCGKSCSIHCDQMSTCDVTVGPSASVNCADGSTCTVKCTGSCSLSCGSGSTCMLQCPTDSAPKTVAQGGQCP